MKNTIIYYIFFVLLSMSSFVFAGDYIGDYCFRAGAIEGNTRLLNLGVSHMGGNHYQVAGTWSWEDGTNRITPINGNVELIGNNFEFTLTFSFYDSEFIYYRVAHMELDKSTLSGINRMLKSKFRLDGTNGGHGSSVMPVSFIECP